MTRRPCPGPAIMRRPGGSDTLRAPMYPDRFRLHFLSSLLIAAAERKRPGLGAWSDATQTALEETFRSELAQMRGHFLETFDDAEHWARIEGTISEVALPRYLTAARN